MKRWLMRRTTVGRPCADLVTEAAGNVERTLKDRPGAYAHPDGSIAVQLSEDGFGPVNPLLRVRFGVAVHRLDGRTEFPLTWQADHTPFAFPHFEGALELEPLSSTATDVVLFGSYDTVGGAWCCRRRRRAPPCCRGDCGCDPLAGCPNIRVGRAEGTRPAAEGTDRARRDDA